MKFSLRTARSRDAEAIAQVLSPSLRLFKFLPQLHCVEEDHWFIENIVLKESEITVVP
jgi:hypothetical protein